MSVTSLAIKRPILFIVFFLLLILFGILSYSNLKYELLPTLATPTITIITKYPGASASEIENAVTKKIEDGILVVSNRKKVYSSSEQNISIVSIDFTDDTNPDAAMQDVQRALNNVVSQLPEGVKPPTLEKFNVNDLPILKLACVSDLQTNTLYKIIDKQIKNEIGKLKGVGKISLMGGEDTEWKIFVNQDLLISRGLSIEDVTAAIQVSNMAAPIGHIVDSDQLVELDLEGKIDSLDKLNKILVKTYPDGSKLYLNDVASFQKAYKEQNTYSSINGNTAVALIINKQSGENAVQVVRNIKNELQDIEKEYRSIHLKFKITSDSSAFTLQSSHQVFEDLGIAILLVAMVMLLFLHSLRNAIIIMISIPVSLFSTTIMMYFCGYTLNLMTLLAISLVIGVLVDDSIVVLENIYHHLELGENKTIAALNGRQEIGFSALSITMVDVVVFFPMALVPGLVGSLIKEFSLVIVTSTLASLVVSFTLTPLIASRFAKLETINSKSLFGKISLLFEKIIDQIVDAYQSILRWALNHKLIVGMIALLVLFSSLMLVIKGIVGSEFLPQADKGEVSLFIKLAAGTKLEETQNKVGIIEKKLNKNPLITSAFSIVGYQNDGISERTTSNIATINIQLVNTEKRNGQSLTSIERNIRDVAMKVSGVDARVASVGLFGANASPIQLTIFDKDRDSIASRAQIIIENIKNIPGVLHPRLSVEEGAPDFTIVLDRTKLNENNVNVSSIVNTLQQDVYGVDQLKLHLDGKEENLRIQLLDKERNSGAALSDISLPIASGRSIRLSQLGNIIFSNTPSALERRDRQPSVTILADVVSRPVGDVGEDIRNKINTIHFPSITKILYEGDLEQEGDAFQNLGLALLVSILLVYLIMVVLYNDWGYPFVILFSIPLAISGALLALALTNKSINVFSIFGLIMMMGLVAKNGILLVDKTNHILGNKLHQNFEIKNALIEAGKARFRPIFMTTIAMVIGMLPLALGQSASSAFSSGLAWVLIGGLSSSMLLTLVVVPIVYYCVAMIKKIITHYKGIKKTITTMMMIGVVVLSIPMKTYSQKNIAISVADAIEMGLSNNVTIEQDKLDIKKSSYGLKESLSYRYPQVNMNMSYYRNIKPTVFFLPTFGVNNQQQITYDASNFQAIPASSNNAYLGNVQMEIPIFNATICGNIQLAAINRKMQQAQLQLSKWQLSDMIRKTYFNALLMKLNEQLAYANLERAQQNLIDCRVLAFKKAALLSDTINAWTNCELMRINLENATTITQQTLNELKKIIGVDLNDSILLSEKINEDTLNTLDSSQLDIKKLENSRPDFRVNELNQELSLQNMEISKSLLKPTLSFVSQYTLQAQADNYNFSNYRFPNSFFVGLQLNVPLFNGFRTQSIVAKNKIDLNKNILERKDLTNTVKLNIRNARLDLENMQNKVAHCLNIINGKKDILQLTRQRWKLGFEKYANVADAELEVIKAQNAWLQSKYGVINDLNILKKESGFIH